jgi:hypothetical protein
MIYIEHAKLTGKRSIDLTDAESIQFQRRDQFSNAFVYV